MIWVKQVIQCFHVPSVSYCTFFTFQVACKYIHDPVLFQRKDLEGEPLVKFDIRYIVMLASTKPLKLYAYKVFWLRFANK